ncbi:hypothetical protein P8452_42115 [Trifolium repens]|nr:hypothetical protein P8452_42115 [Trifolium repens]
MYRRHHKPDCLCAFCVLKHRRKEREENDRIAKGKFVSGGYKHAREFKQEGLVMMLYFISSFSEKSSSTCLPLWGFLVDFMSHVAIVGFVAGAAIVIGLQQLKGLFGITRFTTKTDIICFMKAVWEAFHNPFHLWRPYGHMIILFQQNFYDA